MLTKKIYKAQKELAAKLENTKKEEAGHPVFGDQKLWLQKVRSIICESLNSTHCSDYRKKGWRRKCWFPDKWLQPRRLISQHCSDVPSTLGDICLIKNDLSSATTTVLCLPLFNNKSLEKTLFSSRNFFRIFLVFPAFNKCENLFDNLVYFMYCAAVLIFIFTKWEFSICQDGLSVRFLTDNLDQELISRGIAFVFAYVAGFLLVWSWSKFV